MRTYQGKGGEEIIVRNADLNDIDAAFEVFRSVASEKIYLQTEEVDDSRKEEWFKRWAENGNKKLFAIALVEGRIVGGVDLVPNSSASKNNHVLVLGMFISKEYRGIGVGKHLMDYALQWAGEKEWLKKIILGVYSSNLRAMKLYLDYGFRIEGIIRDMARIEGSYADEITMGLDLRELK